MQGLPLQGTGVLKLVNQHMPNMLVQTLLHPTAQYRVRHQGIGQQLQIVHIHPTLLVF